MRYEALYEKAHMAGTKAVQAFTPQPMIVGSPSTLFGTDIDPNKPTYFVADGVCGFAWVKIKGNTGFAKWAKANGYARPAHPSGMAISVRGYGQSMQKKEVYARAFAQVLSEAGVTAYPESRMD